MTATAQEHLDEAQRYATKVLNDWKKIHDEIEEIGTVDTRPNTYYDTVEEALKHQNTIKTLETNLTIKVRRN